MSIFNTFPNLTAGSGGITTVPHVEPYLSDPSSGTVQGSTGVYKVGQFILNITNGNLWYLAALSSVNNVTTATWTQVATGGGTGVFSSLTVTGLTTLGALTQSGTVNMNTGAVAASTNIGTGAAVQTVIIGSTNTTSSTKITGGTTSFTVSTAGGGNLVGPLGVSGTITFGTSGPGLVFATGPNARVGDATLVSGTVTVANTTISTNSKVFIVHKASNASTALGNYTYTLSAGVSFTINSLDPATPGSVLTTDASTVSYFIVETF